MGIIKSKYGSPCFGCTSELSGLIVVIPPDNELYPFRWKPPFVESVMNAKKK